LLQDTRIRKTIEEEMSRERTVLTIATGKTYYIDLAVNLARSFLWWHAGSDIKFRLVTDNPDHVPADITQKIEIYHIQPGELGKGFSSKLHLDKLATEGKTLFIDSDCLLFDRLNPVFDLFSGRKVSVVGGYISQGEWFGDIGKICKRFDIPHLPKFNGGIYYIEKGAEATAIYDTARGLEKQYDEIGFVRLRNQPNDELIMALAMQLHHQQPVRDDSTIMSDPQACPGGYHIDVISGKRWLVNPPPPDPRHQDWYPFEKVSPLIVHFLGYYAAHYPYKREVFRLKKTFQQKPPSVAAELIAQLSIEYPARLKEWLRITFRPYYHWIWGVRKIKKSERL
jgi:hypothetical protein